VAQAPASRCGVLMPAPPAAAGSGGARTHCTRHHRQRTATHRWCKHWCKTGRPAVRRHEQAPPAPCRTLGIHPGSTTPSYQPPAGRAGPPQSRFGRYWCRSALKNVLLGQEGLIPLRRSLYPEIDSAKSSPLNWGDPGREAAIFSSKPKSRPPSGGCSYMWDRVIAVEMFRRAAAVGAVRAAAVPPPSRSPVRHAFQITRPFPAAASEMTRCTN
jgi:hypothetical protein